MTTLAFRIENTFLHTASYSIEISFAESIYPQKLPIALSLIPEDSEHEAETPALVSPQDWPTVLCGSGSLHGRYRTIPSIACFRLELDL